MNRSCARPGCGRAAGATLSYIYADSAVVVEDLSASPHPMVHDMCDQHADSLSVPRGWTLRDERTVAADPIDGAESDEGPDPQLDLIGA